MISKIDAAPTWSDLNGDEVYHIAHLENDARDAARTLNLKANPQDPDNLYTEPPQTAEALMSHHESRAASWLADKAITGSYAQQEAARLERSNLIADVIDARLSDPADKLADNIIDHFPKEKPLPDGATFTLWKWPGKDYAHVPIPEIKEAISKDGLIPVGPRAALKYAATAKLPKGSRTEGVVVPAISDTIFGNPAIGVHKYRKVPVLYEHAKFGREYYMETPHHGREEDWAYWTSPNRLFLVAKPASTEA